MISALVGFTLAVSTPQWVVPGPGLPAQASNNNVALAAHAGRLYMAWRTAPTHFASDKAKLLVAASADQGRTWALDHEVAVGADLREPYFVELKGRLFLYYVELGRSAFDFTPQHVWRIERTTAWSAPVKAGEDGEVPWEFKVREGRVWKTSYRGGHYDLLGSAKVELRFQSSADGLNWEPAASSATIYTGGLSEAAFAYDRDGKVWMVARNEDGDENGFGSALLSEGGRTFFPERYDSPRMFEHEGEIFLVARRDLGGPYDRGRRWLPMALQRVSNMLAYWYRAKRTALYRIDRQAKAIVWLQDLPSAGDTAFPSVVRLDGRRVLVANYSSPIENPGWSWLRGQLSSRGTGIYLATLTFGP